MIYGALAWWYGIISSFGCLSYLVGAARSFICKGRFFEGLNYFRKIGVWKKRGVRVIIRLKSKFQHRGGLSFAFLCLFSCMVVLYGTIEVAALHLPCVLFLFHWCCSSILKGIISSCVVGTNEVYRVEVYSV